VLTVNTSNLDEVLVGDLVEQGLVLHELGQLDVHRGSKGGTEVCGAGSNVTKVFVVGELALLLDLSCGSAKSVEDLGDSGTLLHRNNSELIFFVDPDEESLGFVVEDTSSRGPVAVEVASLEESVSFPITNKC
jgi:hypothetical protein